MPSVPVTAIAAAFAVALLAFLLTLRVHLYVSPLRGSSDADIANSMLAMLIASAVALGAGAFTFIRIHAQPTPPRSVQIATALIYAALLGWYAVRNNVRLTPLGQPLAIELRLPSKDAQTADIVFYCGTGEFPLQPARIDTVANLETLHLTCNDATLPTTQAILMADFRNGTSHRHSFQLRTEDGSSEWSDWQMPSHTTSNGPLAGYELRWRFVR